MKNLLKVLVSVLVLCSCFTSVVHALEEEPPVNPIDPDEYVIVPFDNDYNASIHKTNLQCTVVVHVSGTIKKGYLNNGELTITENNLSASITSYYVYSGSGYPTLKSSTYTVVGAHLYVQVKVTWHGGYYDGSTITLPQIQLI